MHFPLGRSWRRLLGLTCAILALLTLTAGFFNRSDVSEGAELLLTTTDLTAGSTFELRFGQAMVGIEGVGTIARTSPLRVEPMLPGTFVWTSRRSGLFTPTQPLDLGMEYRFSVRSDLKNAEGKSARVRMVRTFHTPSLTAEASRADRWETTNATPWPRFQVVVNANIEPEELRKHLRYRSGSVHIPAEVVVLTNGIQTYWISGGIPEGNLLPWFRSFPPERMVGESVPKNPTNGHKLFLVLPVKPLPPHDGWILELVAGLPSSESSARTPQPIILAGIGTVLPFGITDVTPSNRGREARSLTIGVTRLLSPSMTNEPPERWIQIEPKATHLAWAEANTPNQLRLVGDFQLRTDYRMTVKAGILAETGEKLASDHHESVEFEPLPSTVWFSEYDTVQLGEGRRALELLVVNQPSTRLRLKKLDENTLIHTLRAYERYTGRHGWEGDAARPERLDYAGVAGITVLDTNLVTKATEDESLRVDIHWNDLIGSNRLGAYFINADVRRPPPRPGEPPIHGGPQGLVQLTDIGLEVKRGVDFRVIRAFSHRTGRPLDDVQISLRTEENEVLQAGATDAHGEVRLPILATERRNTFGWRRYVHEIPVANEGTNAVFVTPAAAWILAQKESDLHAVRLGDNLLSDWRYELPHPEESPDSNQVFVFSDRDAYRPGEVVHLHGLARHWNGDVWEYPSQKAIEVVLLDPQGTKLFTTNLTLVDGGTDWSTDMPSNGRRGAYRTEWKLGADVTQHEIQVRNFEPPAFELTLGSNTNLSPDVPLHFELSARYLFGGPLQRATGHWSLNANSQSFHPEGWSSFTFGLDGLDWQERHRPEAKPMPEQLDLHGSLLLTNGTASVLAPGLATNLPAVSPIEFQLLAEVTDLNQQTVSRGTQMIRHPSDFYLGFRWKAGDETIFATNQSLAFELVATTTDGRPVMKPQEVSVKLERIEWRSVKVRGAGRTIDYRYEREVFSVGSQTVFTQPVRKVGERWEVESEPGRAPLRFLSLSEPGSYTATFATQDSAHHLVETRVSFYVSGDGRVAWNYRNGSMLTLVPDKASYHPGETATVLVEAPFDGTAWVTTGRENVRHSFALEVHGNAPSFQIPIQTNDSPNVYVSVTLVRGHGQSPREFPMPEWRVGILSLPVIDPFHRLTMKVQPDRDRHFPGDDASVTASVTDADGRPVAGASVTVYAVDDSFLLMTERALPDPLGDFYRPRGLKVESTLSLPDLLSENPELRSFLNKGATGGGGGTGKRPRSVFTPCPLWNDKLVTDAQGKVSTTFRLPDSLTRYRLVAVATHGPSRFGSGDATFEVEKELMIEPSLPPVAHVGDRLVARAVVFNRSLRDLNLTATMMLGERALGTNNGPKSHSFAMAAGVSRALDFPVEFTAVGSDDWTWSVAADSDGIRPDSVRRRMNILDAGTELRDIVHVRLGATPTNLLAAINPELLEGTGTIEVRASASPLAFLAEGVGELLHYPYGCIEQTSSSLIPWLALRNFPELRPEEFRDPTNIVRAVNTGINRLVSMQTSSGGLGYWPGDGEPQFWGSAYAAWVLALARDAGFSVPEGAQKRLNDWLSRNWRSPTLTKTNDWSERSLTAVALSYAGQADASLNQLLVEQADHLTSEDRALAALAITHAHGDTNMALRLLTEGAGHSGVDGRFGHPARRMAIQLLAWISVSNNAPSIDGMVDRLLASQRRGHWDTTQGNAWAVWALSDYSRRMASGSLMRGKWLFDLHEHGWEAPNTNGIAYWKVDFTPESAQGGLTLMQTAGTHAFVEVSVTGHRVRRSDVTAAVDHGFSLRRTYARLDDDNRPQSLLGLKVGDRVLVTLEVVAQNPAAWVAIEDPLPSVLEAVHGVFKNQQTAASSHFPEWNADYQEFRQDRTWFFFNELPDGRRTIRYVARVRTEGNAWAAPAKMEAMYEPDRNGFSAGERMEVIGGDGNADTKTRPK